MRPGGRVALALAVVAGWHGLVGAEERGEALRAPLPGVYRERFAEGERIDLVLEGRIRAWTLGASQDEAAVAYLLLGPAPNELGDPAEDREPVNARPPCPGELETSAVVARAILEPGAKSEILATGLPGDARGLLVVPGRFGGGAESVLVVTGNGIDRIDGGALVPMIEGDEPAWASSAVRRRGEDLVVSLPGAFRIYAARPGAGAGRLRGEVAIPPVVVRAPEGFRIALRDPQPVPGPHAEAPAWYGFGPEKFGDRRLRVTLLAVAGGEAAPDRLEAWCRLPGREEVLDSRILRFHDRPALVATTRRADKLSLFGEKRLRLWFLERDRSRSGRDPAFAVESRLNLWQDPRIEVVDVDGDGNEDLVLGYWKGLKDSRVVLDIYPGGEDGVPSPTPITTAFDVEDADESGLLFGPDVTGDGRPDLVVLTDSSLRVHAGRPRDGKGGVVERRHPVVLPLGDLPSDPSVRGMEVGSGGARFWSEGGLDRVRAVDLEGDGTFELVRYRAGASAERPGFLQLFRVRSPQP